MKKTMIIIALLLAFGLSLAASPRHSNGSAPFQEGDMFLTPQIGFNSHTTPIGANFEYALTDNIGIGGSLMYWHWSESNFFGDWSLSVVSLSAEAAYHFTAVKVKKLDLYAGAGLGYMSLSTDSGFGDGYDSGISLDPFVAARYYLGHKIALNLKLYIDLLGDFNGVSSTLGVTFKL